MKNNQLTDTDIGELTYAKALVDSVKSRYIDNEEMIREFSRLKTISDKISQLINKE